PAPSPVCPPYSRWPHSQSSPVLLAGPAPCDVSQLRNLPSLISWLILSTHPSAISKGLSQSIWCRLAHLPARPSKRMSVAKNQPCCLPYWPTAAALAPASSPPPYSSP